MAFASESIKKNQKNSPLPFSQSITFSDSDLYAQTVVNIVTLAVAEYGNHNVTKIVVRVKTVVTIFSALTVRSRL